MGKLKYLYRWDLLLRKIKGTIEGRSKFREDKVYWESLKNKYAGERGFVIGNGPSLQIKDLTKIKDNNDISIASNKVFLAFDQTPWRPTIFTIADGLVWDKIGDIIHEDIKLVHTRRNLNFKKSNVPVKVWKRLNNHFPNSGNVQFSEDIPNGMYPGGTVTFENLQLAIYMGLNPIYIIGCDHYYGGEEDQQGEIITHKGGVENHFIKGYRKPGEKAGKANVEYMNAAYKATKEFALKNNIKVYNATRGGHLEFFERKDFDQLFISQKQN